MQQGCFSFHYFLAPSRTNVHRFVILNLYWVTPGENNGLPQLPKVSTAFNNCLQVVFLSNKNVKLAGISDDDHARTQLLPAWCVPLIYRKWTRAYCCLRTMEVGRAFVVLLRLTHATSRKDSLIFTRPDFLRSYCWCSSSRGIFFSALKMLCQIFCPKH